MASSYGVSVDLSGILAQNGGLMQALYPLLSQAVTATAEIGAYRWKESVYKARLWEVEKNRYVESITWQMTGPFSAEISTDYDKAQEIETGRPAYDMKRVLQTSKKVRIAKGKKHRGQRYLIIPFRHNVPTGDGEGALARQMPAHVYEQAKALSASSVLPLGSVNSPTRMSGSGHLVTQQSYSWGERLPAGLTPKAKAHHVTDLHDSMVRFDTTPNGGPRRSTYLTFRVLGEWSKGWVRQAQPGLEIADKVASGLQSTLDENIGQAVTLGMLRR